MKNTKQNKTLVAFLLDRTGSMQLVKQETISGFNSYLKGLKSNKGLGSVRLHMSQFDSEGIDVLHDMVRLADVPELSDKTFVPRSWTPLYDAIGKTVERVQKASSGRKVIFVTLTDGQENASKEWNDKTIKDLIKSKEEKDKWTFAYIGIGPEAWSAVGSLAANTMGASNVLRSTARNTAKAYGAMGQTVARYCMSSGDTVMTNAFAGKQLDKDDE